MITRFGSLFAGHVDLDDEGLEGTAANDRWLSDERLATVFPKRRGHREAHGPDRLRHLLAGRAPLPARRVQCIPNVLMLALISAISPEHPDRLRLQHRADVDPIRMAEDFATVDWLTNGGSCSASGAATTPRGRGVRAPLLGRAPAATVRGRSSHLQVVQPARLLAPGNHDPAARPYRATSSRRSRFAPAEDAAGQCWQPVVGASPRALDFMAKHDIQASSAAGRRPAASGRYPRLPGGHPAPGGRASRAGPLHRVPFHIADSVERGSGATPFFEEHQDVRPLGFVQAHPEQIEAVADPKRRVSQPAGPEPQSSGTWLIGPPELITEQLMESSTSTRAEVVNVGQPVGTPQAVILEQLERFSAQVMPAFKSKAKEGRPW
jgi:hypothetical protein